MPNRGGDSVIPCVLAGATKALIDDYVKALRAAAPALGAHGLEPDVFWDSGIFRGAIERIRGTQAAGMETKRRFVTDILDWLKAGAFIESWSVAGSNDRHDYEVVMPGGRICAIEAKGCLDGNNTNIFERPANADEFVIWSLCQNAGADPAKNAWSGIHTRLSAEIIHRRTIVDGLVIWDPVCNTLGRPCPKVRDNPERLTVIGKRQLPPPCLYLFPRTVPDVRNNPSPSVHTLGEVQFLSALHLAFRGAVGEITEVKLEVALAGNTVARATRLIRAGQVVRESKMTKVKRAKS